MGGVNKGLQLFEYHLGKANVVATTLSQKNKTIINHIEVTEPTNLI